MKLESKAKNQLNVFGYQYRPWRYIRNWFYNIRQFFKNLKYAYYRAKYGFCPVDVWNLHESLSYLLYNEFKYLADNHCGYPGRGDFSDENGGDEAWTAYLNEMAEHFLNSTECEEIPINQQYEKLLNDTYEGVTMKIVDDPNDRELGHVEFVYNDPEKYEKLRKQLDSIDAKITKFRESEKNKALAMLKKYYFNLWD